VALLARGELLPGGLAPLDAPDERARNDIGEDLHRQINALLDEHTDTQVACVINQRGLRTEGGSAFRPDHRPVDPLLGQPLVHRSRNRINAAPVELRQHEPTYGDQVNRKEAS
jgi:hypothetical protein